MPMRERVAEQQSTSRQILTPFNPKEAIVVSEAALRAGVSVSTIRYWSDRRGIGRLVGGRYRISRLALEMVLAGDEAALELYHAGKLSHPSVAAYFERSGLASPAAS